MSPLFTGHKITSLFMLNKLKKYYPQFYIALCKLSALVPSWRNIFLATKTPSLKESLRINKVKIVTHSRYYSVILSILFLGLFSGCFQDPSEINTSTIDESIKFQGLPVVFINTNHEINPLQKVNVGIREMDSSGTLSDVVYGKIKIRTGDHPDKKQRSSYSVELKNEHGFAGLQSGKEWIFKSPDFDPTLLKDKLTGRLLQEFDPHVITAQIEMIQLFVNGEDIGIYLLVEKLNEDRLKISSAYENAVIFKEPDIFRQKGEIFNQRYPPVHVLDFTRIPLQLKELFFEKSDEEFLDNQNGVFSVFERNNILSWHLVLLLSGDTAAMHKSFYLYNQQQDDKLQITIWDYENAFGTTWNGEPIDAHNPTTENILFQRLLSQKDSAYYYSLQEKWFELRNDKLIDSSSLNSWIDEHVQSTIKLSTAKNSKPFYNSTSLQSSIEELKIYIGDRIKNLDGYFGYD